MKTKQLKQDILNQQKSTVKSPCKRNNFRKRFKISRLVEVKLPFKQLFKAVWEFKGVWVHFGAHVNMLSILLFCSYLYLFSTLASCMR